MNIEQYNKKKLEITEVDDDIVSCRVFAMLPGWKHSDKASFPYEEVSGEALALNSGDAIDDQTRIVILKKDYPIEHFTQSAVISKTEVDELNSMNHGLGVANYDVVSIKNEFVLESVLRGVDKYVFSTLTENTAESGKPIKTLANATALGSAVKDRGEKTANYIQTMTNALFLDTGKFKPMVILAPISFNQLLGERYANSDKSVAEWIKETFKSSYGVEPQFVCTNRISTLGVYILDNRLKYMGQGAIQPFSWRSPFMKHDDIEIRGEAKTCGFVAKVNGCGVYKTYSL